MEIKILEKAPVIFTKDRDFVKHIPENPLKEGQIILLPEDAILLKYSNNYQKNKYGKTKKQ